MPKDMTGSLSKNKDKAKEGANPKWPDYKGSANVEGVEHWLAAWINTGKDNEKYLSINFTRKDKPQEQKPQEQNKVEQDAQAAQARIDVQEELPF